MPRAATRRADAPVTTGAMHGDTPTQRIVPATGARGVVSAVTSVFDAAAKAKPSARGGRRQILPLLDPSTLVLRRDVPMPTMLGRTAKGATRYDVVFNLLTADGMSVAGIDIQYRAALQKAAQSYMQACPALAAESRLTVRTLSETECGVWRVRKEGRT